MKFKIRLFSLLFSLLCVVMLSSCYADKDFLDKLHKTDEEPKVEEEIPTLDTLEGTLLTEEENVHWIGRTEYRKEDKKVYTYFAGTGYTVRFQGTSLSVTYHTDNATSNKNRPYFYAYADGNESAGERFCLTSNEQTVNVVSGLKEGIHTVTVLKESEPENALTSISKMQTDGGFLAPNVKVKYRFQIIGSSGITGHGCLGAPSEGWTTKNSSALHGFGYLAAKQFGAECQFVSASACGLSWTYRNVSVMADMYEAAGAIAKYNNKGDTQSVTACGTWDHTQWTPDVVIANIGGNDWNIMANMAGDRATLENTFKTAVVTMVTRIHTLYPNAKIIWTANSTASGNGGLAKAAVNDLSFKNQIFFVSIDNTKDGADNHASVATQTKNAETVVKAIEQACGYEKIS